MNRFENNQQDVQQSIVHQTAPQPPDPNKRKEANDDSLENANPNDSRADEKVIVNEQTSNKTVNAPSQTAVNSSDSEGSEEDSVY